MKDKLGEGWNLQLARGTLNMTRNQTKALGWKRVCGSEEQEGEQREMAGRHVLSQSTGRSRDCLGDYPSLYPVL